MKFQVQRLELIIISYLKTQWITNNVYESQHRNINIDVPGNMTYCLVLYFEIDQLKEI